MTNTIERAIIMAAGTGSRMRPLTERTPKPLVKVNGVRMIDTVIHALHENGITEIYVVVGYLKECFQQLPEQYPGLQLIENPYYDTCNNISSLYVARNHINNTIILDGDQIITNAQVLEKNFERSGYNCVWCEGKTEEWLLEMDGGIVRSCSRNGGENGWQLFSVSRWTEEDGQKLKKHLEMEFEEKKNRQIYWDDVALFCYPEQYELGVYPMQYGDVTEIDSLQELCEVDSSYTTYGTEKVDD